jgi:hypothetical protein
MVTLALVDGTLLLTVRDGSPGLRTRGPTRDTDSSGRGLGIVDNLSLDWGMNADAAGSKAIWASFAVKAQPAVQPPHAQDLAD